MLFNFDTKHTEVSGLLKFWSFPPVKYSKALAWIFLYVFVAALLLVALSFIEVIGLVVALKIAMAALALCLLFFQLHVFASFAIKHARQETVLSDTILSLKEYNLAEFLNLPACDIVQRTVVMCQKKRLAQVTSEALFYLALKINRDCQTLCWRLGIDAKKLQEEVKNHLEKSPRSDTSGILFSPDFQKTIAEAARLAVLRGQKTISPKELLAALAKCDGFFQKVLMDYDVKEKDVDNLTLWQAALEERIEKSREFWTREHLARFGSLGKDFAAGFTVTLDQFAIDWRKVVKRNSFAQVIGHQKEIEELQTILTTSALRNALIVGEPGTGRKSIVEGLAQRCYLGTGLPELTGKRVVELDMVALAAKVQDAQILESTLDQIFSETLASGNVILVIDNLENFAGLTSQKPGTFDLSGILAKYLALQNFYFIGITTFDGVHRNLEQNPSFLEYFRRLEVSEISELETIMLLQNMALLAEKKHRILVTYPAIREIINLTGRYFPSLPFPKKAIDVLDEAMVYANNQKDGQGNKSRVVLPSHIAAIISQKAKIPVGKMEFKEKSVLLNLENLIHQKIVGQAEAVEEIAIALRRARSGISSKKRPMGVFLFLGPTGVGKTETAKALAEIYFNGEEKMIRLDMSEFQSISDIPRLIGQVSPVEEQGLLTTPVRENPFSLVLLDEIEKSHPNILNLFLQVFDEGHITDGQGRKVIFTNTIIICTSNAGADMIFKQVEGGQKIEKSSILDTLFEKGIFKPEFINRFDAAVLFSPLTRENLLQIAQLNLASLAKNLKEKDINFVVTEPLKEKIVELSYKPEFGARQMRRVIQDKVENKVAQALLSDTIVKGDTIAVAPDNFEVIKNPAKE